MLASSAFGVYLQRFALLLTHPHRQSCFLPRRPPVRSLLCLWCCGSTSLQTAVAKRNTRLRAKKKPRVPKIGYSNSALIDGVESQHYWAPKFEGIVPKSANQG